MNTKPFASVLIVDDDLAICQLLKDILEVRNISYAHTSRSLDSMWKKLNSKSYDLLFLDLGLPDGDGKDVLKDLAKMYPKTSVVVITGNRDIDLAVECMQNGVIDFIAKPLQFDRVVRCVTKSLQHLDLIQESLHIRSQILKTQTNRGSPFHRFLSVDRPLLQSILYLEAMASNNQPVLIRGESGVGKSMLCEIIHEASSREGSLISINCAGLTDNQILYRLFEGDSPLVEKASGGTLLIENVDLCSQHVQLALLHLLEFEEYFQSDNPSPKFSNVRLLFTSLLNESEIATKLRPDLLHRLLRRSVWVPPLRERPQDTVMHAKSLIPELTRQYNLGNPHIPDEIFMFLQIHPLPGNYNDLHRLLRETFSKHDNSSVLSLEDIKSSLKQWIIKPPLQKQRLITNPFVEINPLPSLQEASDFLVEEALSRTGGNQTAAGLLLGVTQQAISRRIKKVEPVDS